MLKTLIPRGQEEYINGEEKEKVGCLYNRIYQTIPFIYRNENVLVLGPTEWESIKDRSDIIEFAKENTKNLSYCIKTSDAKKIGELRIVGRRLNFAIPINAMEVLEF